MKKRTRNILRFVALLFLLLVIVFLLSPFFFIKYIFTPLFSPFYPDFAPFNAQVTIASNSPPRIEDINNDIFICENNVTNLYFNVTDADGDSLSVGIAPPSPFFVSPLLTFKGATKTQINIFSGVLDKSFVDVSLGYKKYERLLTAGEVITNGGELSDRKQINISVIEINNAPNLANIGVQTVWTKGDDSTFYYQAQVNDIEDGNQNSGNFIFSLNFLGGINLFNIANNGTMIFTPDPAEITRGTYRLGVYDIDLCVGDNAITPTHPRIISECNQNGDAIEVCKRFSLTITDENRAPDIVNYYPLNLSFNASGTEKLSFNVTVRDPDGTIPDIYWYLDGALANYTSGSNFSKFVYTFPCGISGDHRIKIDATDGLLNDSLEWNISLSYVQCPISITVGGGGGGGGSLGRCDEKWGCLDWGVCQESNSSFRGGLLAKEDFDIISKVCKDSFLSEDKCGFQIRNCRDVNVCNITRGKPEDISYCAFVNNPSCSDSVKNCHSGGCELLVDCGGPCNACPTCSDGTKNQGEKGIDCGGPCPNICPPKPPLLERLRAKYVLSILLILVIMIIVIQIIRAYKTRKEIKHYNEAVE